MTVRSRTATSSPPVAYAARAWLAALCALGLASAGGAMFAAQPIIAGVLWLVAFLVAGTALEQSEYDGITKTLELMDHVEEARNR